jgi:hypothetical protein
MKTLAVGAEAAVRAGIVLGIALARGPATLLGELERTLAEGVTLTKCVAVRGTAEGSHAPIIRNEIPEPPLVRARILLIAVPAITAATRSGRHLRVRGRREGLDDRGGPEKRSPNDGSSTNQITPRNAQTATRPRIPLVHRPISFIRSDRCKRRVRLSRPHGASGVSFLRLDRYFFSPHESANTSNRVSDPADVAAGHARPHG